MCRLKDKKFGIQRVRNKLIKHENIKIKISRKKDNIQFIFYLDSYGTSIHSICFVVISLFILGDREKRIE
jgi:hypothetical protein